MSVEAIAVVLHHSKASGTDKLVLLGIANHYGDGGAWPAIATLAKYANVTERTVQRSLQALCRLGEIQIEYRDGGGTRRGPYATNRFWLHVSCPDECDRSTNHRTEVTATSPLATEVTSTSGLEVTHTSPLEVTPTSPEPSLEPSRESLTLVQMKFEEFWAVYPRKQGRGAALDSFETAYRKEGDRVVGAARTYASDPNLPKDKTFIPLPATWLNQERWLDEPLPARELTPEELKEQKSAEARRKGELDRERTLRLLEESRRREAEALANPPKKCEHDRVAVVCPTCSKLTKSQTNNR